ncbi:MAG: thermonuclease family protein [Stenomitos rutilans HA7619-LM2]|jgi:micrococcal nuclease|nr:thermonuclease family protein [Stenomitos rutilans HA7619-LM2]
MKKAHDRVGHYLKWLGLVVFFMLLTGCQPNVPVQGLTIDVQRVLSGREFEVAGVAAAPDLTERVRLEGIDVPDVRQEPWGTAAKRLLETYLQQKSVLLETDAEPRDAFGRRLAYVWQGDRLLNEVLVAEGYAIVTPHPPNSKYDRRLAQAQEHARVLGLGLWNPKQPMRVSPAEFRSQQRQKVGVGSRGRVNASKI